MFNIFVKFRTDEFAHWAIMRDRDGDLYLDRLAERWGRPTGYGEREIGKVLAEVFATYKNIERVEVKPVFDEPTDDEVEVGGSAGYSEACGVWN